MNTNPSTRASADTLTSMFGFEAEVGDTLRLSGGQTPTSYVLQVFGLELLERLHVVTSVDSETQISIRLEGRREALWRHAKRPLVRARRLWARRPW